MDLFFCWAIVFGSLASFVFRVMDVWGTDRLWEYSVKIMWLHFLIALFTRLRLFFIIAGSSRDRQSSMKLLRHRQKPLNQQHRTDMRQYCSGRNNRQLTNTVQFIHRMQIEATGLKKACTIERLDKVSYMPTVQNSACTQCSGCYRSDATKKAPRGHRRAVT